MNYTADFLWLGRCKGKLSTSLRLRGAALKAFVEVGTSAAVRAVLQRASRLDASGLREELGGQPFDLVRTQLKKDAEVRDEQWHQIVLSHDEKWQKIVLSHDEQWQRVVQSRDKEWQRVVLHRDEEWRTACLEQRSRDDAWRSRLSDVVEAWLVDARGTSDSLAALGSALASLPFRLGQKISDVVSAAVMSPGSALVKNLRAATKKVAVRSTHSARRFPSEQKATQLEVLSSLVSLLSVAVRFFPEMHYDVWKAARGSFGKAAKKERVRRNGLDATSAEYVDRPLLWSFAGEGTAEGGGSGTSSCSGTSVLWSQCGRRLAASAVGCGVAWRAWTRRPGVCRRMLWLDRTTSPSRGPFFPPRWSPTFLLPKKSKNAETKHAATVVHRLGK